jgi:hypothetical protein
MHPRTTFLWRLTAIAGFSVWLGTLSGTARAQATCPCSIWSPAATPGTPAVTDNQPIEIGVKFRSDSAGFVTAIRFYKGSLNTGTHVGHLWSAAGALLAEATFTSETVSGWQEIQVSPAVAIAANTTYIASYHSESGYFAFDNGFFGATGIDNAPLHALAAGLDGPNGVFRYGGSAFPNGGGSNNYWVDVVFQTDLGPDVTPPTVTQQVPASGAGGVGLASTIRALFSEAIDPATVSAASFELRDPSNQHVSSSVTYDLSARTAVLATTGGLLANATYTATLKGGTSGIHDLAGNALAADVVWSFTTGTPTPPADEGTGGPILIVSSSSNPFGRYYAEILRTEGLNAFTATDISLVTAGTLSAHDVVILGEMPLTATQVAMLSDYVSAGGNLIAMRPDKQLASLLGLSDASATLSNAYLLVNTAAAPGAGIVGDTIQFHSTADRYTPNGAAVVATLYADTSTSTGHPAVTIANVGANDGHAAAFTFDLARSIVYTRQGNPAWSGLERDGVPLIRSDDLFFGAAAGDVQPDWVDLNKVAIPQADEQQRLLANLVQHLNRARKPLPRFWYLPRGAKAAFVMTGDDHDNLHDIEGTIGRFDQYKALSPTGCSVADWQCVRSTSYIYNSTTGMDDATSLAFENEGFEVALHVSSDCANWTPASLDANYASQLTTFASMRPSVPAPTTNRTHCIAWSDYVTQPKVELAHGIRFDTNYYYYPEAWIQNRPGLFTGSAMPMRFADLDGTTIDVYQATTQMTDESGQTYPFTSDTLFDRALGPLGYYGVYTANMHTDKSTEQPSDASVASALARNIPIVSARQMLAWIDGRNGSSFNGIAWASGTLTFAIVANAGANGLTAMVPASGRGGPLTALTRDGAVVSYTVQTIKGVDYAFFPASAGNYAATYVVDAAAPIISGVTATLGAGNTASVSWSTNEPADSRVDYGTSPGALTTTVTGAALVTSHALTLSGLAPSTTYYYRVTSADAALNSATSPLPPSAPASFATSGAGASSTVTDSTLADFSAGSTAGPVSIAQAGNGELILAPAVAAEFSGTSLPADWSATAWNAGGTATVTGGALIVDGARAGTVATFTSGRSLEFVATFSGAAFQHVGFADTLESTPWAIFSTLSGGALYARTNSGSASIDTPLPASLVGTPHRYRIDWTASSVVYSVDGAVVASHALAIAGPLRPLASDFSVGDGAISIDWLRLGPFGAAGTFVSRVFDATTTVSWNTLSWISQTPSDTAIVMAVRTGDTPIPDATWTTFRTICVSGGAIGTSARYAQYRAVLVGATDAQSTPVLEQVEIGYSTP